MYDLLRKAREKKAHGEAGFTLIELLVVILVIGILAAIVVVAVGGTSGDAKAKACSQDASNLHSAITNYQASAGNWPTATGTAVAVAAVIPGSGSTNTYTYTPYTFTSGATTGDLDAVLIPKYISKIPTDLAAFLVNSNGSQFVVVAPGAGAPSGCTAAGI